MENPEIADPIKKFIEEQTKMVEIGRTLISLGLSVASKLPGFTSQDEEHSLFQWKNTSAHFNFPTKGQFTGRIFYTAQYITQTLGSSSLTATKISYEPDGSSKIIDIDCYIAEGWDVVHDLGVPLPRGHFRFSELELPGSTLENNDVAKQKIISFFNSLEDIK